MATVIDTRMPIQEREQWADTCFEQVDEKRDAWLSIPFVRFVPDDRRAVLQPTVQIALWCWAWSMLLSVVLVEFIHGRNRSRSHKHNVWSNFVAKSPSVENLLRVQRAAATASTVSKAISSRRHAI